jgi:bifunctional DNA-binding transcriptional regulator/antitoxin component of YhaV-PrlF toxin-antitoxin module
MIKEERKLIKFSNYSLCVTLPKSVVTKLKWQKGDIVQTLVDEENESIIISKPETAKSSSKKKQFKSIKKKAGGNSPRW